MIGLFQLNFERSKLVALPSHKSLPNAVPILHFNLGVDYLLSSIFIYYFAVFTSNSFKTNVACFICRLLVLFIYAPLLFYVGDYIDGAIVASILICRLVYTAFYSIKYRSVYFLLFNSVTLVWFFGKCWFLPSGEYTCLRGGDSYLKFGPHFVPFISDKDVYLAVRGKLQSDVHLVRRVELINGDFLYIFGSQPVVCVTTIRDFYSSQLSENGVETN
nr:hypothetical protein [Bat coronavirus]